ncbi:hypothetical protein V2A60_001391 [Cordyceps javanica]|uniref:P-loop containing nucleoside triphosphate hydrolase n=1 Tax=Cordyceps javanica TaxID=43265 RepID=A0A545VEY7_9HYPO|nr:P-loop containing nucleoside triphosphate hydrolase [Cordyceps javanica]TQW11486.1 P-loop containing nucleoside triphosphate hydrolase [Cordyceps javanica]
MKLLNLPSQKQAISNERGGYFFLPAATSMNRAGMLRRSRLEWSEGETNELRRKYQSCCDELQQLLDEADQQNKMAVTKEHAPFIMSPTTISDYLFGSPNDAVPWTVQVPQSYSTGGRLSGLPGLPPNPSVLPDELLLRCAPAFLIRHPALAFPSYYRVVLSFCDGDMARMENEMVPYAAIGCTLRWTRQLFDWYAAAWAALGHEAKEPIVLEADDMIQDHAAVLRFCSLIGLDHKKVQFHWDPLTKEDQTGMDSASARTRITLNSSEGIKKGKTFDGLTIEVEVEKWKAEFGEQIGTRIEGWVRAAMPDYTYLVGKKLRANSASIV